ncbi:MAG: NAD(P)H-dependent oxidoreductase [Micavibrio aeruginosavorus]|uniref:NAD(P)H-dependent oxidoreductase n=1 Tax=Micavibrio aeruginosavorus TaxID=349221 RepID=A0A7T5UIB2_9BACT|nr:MAG: NAD(P)H-dependent oxidoreductase [Micavibrio aeruginosavorus]
MMKIAVVVGSLRKNSYNKKLARALEKLAMGKMSFTYVDIASLPLFNQDLEADLPPAVMKLKADIESADGVLFVTPEYNRSIPGVLKNAIDWASRPYGQSSWAGRPAAICGTSPGAIGTAVAQMHLRSIASGFLDMPVLGQPEIYITYKDEYFDADQNVVNDATRKFLQGFLDKFASWVALHAAACRCAPRYSRLRRNISQGSARLYRHTTEPRFYKRRRICGFFCLWPA